MHEVTGMVTSLMSSTSLNSTVFGRFVVVAGGLELLLEVVVAMEGSSLMDGVMELLKKFNLYFLFHFKLTFLL